MEIKQNPIVEAIFALSKLLKEQITSDLKLVHLSVLQLQALVFLHQHPDSAMSDIANFFKIELPSATSLINKLVDMDLAIRKEDKKDRRLVRISVTTQGQNLLAEGMKARAKHMEKVVSYLSEDDQQALLRILQTLIKTMEEQNEK
ncbi:MAG TPA: MarR family winged helix-turn-helix transcriptional regulator [Patescibacteria group bacterium]